MSNSVPNVIERLNKLRVEHLNEVSAFKRASKKRLLDLIRQFDYNLIQKSCPPTLLVFQLQEIQKEELHYRKLSEKVSLIEAKLEASYIIPTIQVVGKNLQRIPGKQVAPVYVDFKVGKHEHTK